MLSINWEDVLAVFFAKVTDAEDGAQVDSLDDVQLDELRNIMWEMNAITSSTRTESHEVEVTEVDEDGNETTYTETGMETILEITITHKTAEEMARQYGFNARQNEYLALMSEPKNQNLWAELLDVYKRQRNTLCTRSDDSHICILNWRVGRKSSDCFSL